MAVTCKPDRRTDETASDVGECPFALGRVAQHQTLYLPYAGAEPAIDSAWTLQVKGYTVSQLRARIPPFPSHD